MKDGFAQHQLWATPLTPADTTHIQHNPIEGLAAQSPPHR